EQMLIVIRCDRVAKRIVVERLPSHASWDSPGPSWRGRWHCTRHMIDERRGPVVTSVVVDPLDAIEIFIGDSAMYRLRSRRPQRCVPPIHDMQRVTSTVIFLEF